MFFKTKLVQVLNMLVVEKNSDFLIPQGYLHTCISFVMHPYISSVQVFELVRFHSAGKWTPKVLKKGLDYPSSSLGRNGEKSTYSALK